MTPERYKQIEEIFSAALELETGKRNAFVERACAADHELRREVESLLVAQLAADQFIETPALEVAAEMLAVEQTRTLAGRRIGHYRIQYLLGAGGMGEIYLAEDTRLDRRVALKLLPAQFTGDDARLRRFMREAKSASALNHPNILTVYDIGQADEIHFIATEFIEGNTLRRQMQGRRLPLVEALDVAMQIAGALAAAHAAGIIHRDIKPENVMVRPDGLVKVLDFGLAKLGERPAQLNDTRTLTLTGVTTLPGMVMGTPQYMSPEQARGLQVDHRSDIFSLGVVLYEMIAGCPPFTGDSVADVIAGILAHAPPPLVGYRPEAADDLQQVIARSLAKPTDERYQTIKDLQNDLKRVKERLEFQTRDTPPAQSASGNSQTATSRARQREARRTPPQTSQISLLPQLHPNNLPAQPRSLVGRDHETVAVINLLRRDDVRLLTLTGPGGTGKTSLALQAATDLLGEFADGVFFISLALINDAQLVASIMAQELAIKEAAGKPLLDSLKEYLRDKRMLLVLDNFEHLLTAAALVAELLAECPRLKILATSRAVLHLRAEHEYSLAPLRLPDTERLPAPEELIRCPAIALFLQRAVAVKPDFKINQENARAIAEICVRLDGLPLAIELAAARIRMLSPQSLLARLEKRFQLLIDGARDLPARQQTMRDAIAWSYELLSDDEKLLFRRLSIFVGGCVLEAIEAVCDGAGDLKIDILSGVASLVDKSLVRKNEPIYGDEAQFGMLETIREYGLERLASSGESEALQQRHAAFYLALAEEAEPELKGSWQAVWLERLESEHGNFRLALQWARQVGQVELGLRLCGALARFWMVRNHFREARGWLEDFLALAETEGASASVQAKALLGLGSITRTLGDYVRSAVYCESSLVLYRELGDKRGIAHSLTSLANTVFEQGNNQRGVQLLEEGLALKRELQDKWGIALSLNNLGTIAYQEGDYERAKVFYEESQVLRLELEDKQGLAISLNNLGAIAYQQGDYERAKSLTAESLTAFQSLGDRAGTAHCLEGLAESLAAEGQLQRAARLLGAAQAVRATANALIPPHYRADYETIIASLCDTLGEPAYSAHLAQGQRMSLEEAVAYALGRDLSDALQATVALQDQNAPPNINTAAAPLTTQPPSPQVTSENLAEDGAALAAAPAAARAPQTALSSASRRRIVVSMAVASIVLIGVAGALFFLRPFDRASATNSNRKPASLAVLPFRSLGGEADEYLSIGLTDLLITKLGGSGQLSVRPTSAVLKYNRAEQDPNAAGHEMGVEWILEGTIIKSREKVRVTVQLVNVASGAQHWSATFDERLQDVFMLEDRVSAKVADAMALNLSSAARQRLATPYTESSEAYTQYVQGRFHWNKRTGEAMLKSVEHYKKAVALDGRFALAYAGLADAYNLLGGYEAMPVKEAAPVARQAALKALEIDDSLAEAHASLAWTLWEYDWDWPSADREFKRALELNPRYATGHQWYAHYLATMGRLDEALAEIEQARQLDSSSLVINSSRAWMLNFTGQSDRAIEEFRKTLELDAGFTSARSKLLWVYAQSGRHQETIGEARLLSLPADKEMATVIEQAYEAAGYEGAMRKWLDTLIERAKGVPVWPSDIVRIQAILGEKDQAIEWLERAYGEHSGWLVYLKVDPVFANLRTDKRFQDLLRRIGLAD